MAVSPSAQQFVQHTGIAAPFLQPDVEGELIAPLGPGLQDLHDVHLEPGGMVIEPHDHDGSWTGQHAFQGFRYDLDGSEKPEFVLNQEPYRDASILLAGRNFGLGSLQGFAVIRLMQCGMRVVIAPSFGPVFYDDCFDYGLLPVTLEEAVIEGMVQQVRAHPRVETSVDLVSQTVERAGMEPIPFAIDARRRLDLLMGTDSSLEERLEHADSAAARRERDRRSRPWLYDRPGSPR
jgi:3-isopropylmalate/(R)-2-methylmalate dehydratase small subunit